MSIITQNTIGLNTSIERQLISHWIKKQNKKINFKDTHKLKVKKLKNTASNTKSKES